MGSPAVRRLQKRIESMRKSTRRAREKAGEVVENVLCTAETAGTGFALGYAEARFPEAFSRGIFGVNPSLAAGIGCHAFAMFGSGNADDHFRAVGNGALTAYAFTKGREFASRAGISGADPSDYLLDAHYEPAVSGDELAYDDIADLADAY